MPDIPYPSTNVFFQPENHGLGKALNGVLSVTQNLPGTPSQPVINALVIGGMCRFTVFSDQEYTFLFNSAEGQTWSKVGTIPASRTEVSLSSLTLT